MSLCFLASHYWNYEKNVDKQNYDRIIRLLLNVDDLTNHFPLLVTPSKTSYGFIWVEACERRETCI